MPSGKSEREMLRAYCAELHPEDGVDPREDKRRDARKNDKRDRKVLQLCSQVARTLELCLAGLPQAAVLAGASVREVLPAPDAGRLRVVVVVADAEQCAETDAVLARYSGTLRAQIAEAITRRRAPELVFAVVVEGGGDA